MQLATPNYLSTLSRFVSDTRYEDIPVAVIDKAKIHLLDTIGASLAGTRSAEFLAIRPIVKPVMQGGVQIWGADFAATPRDAALLNGVAAHVFELDDTGGCDHSGAVIVPAMFSALADSEKPVTGRSFLTAMIIGYDVARRALEAAGGYDLHNSAGWHSTATCGPIGAASAVANLWEMSEKLSQNAITISTSFSSGLWAFIHDGSQTKKIHAGRAAEGGLLAAEMARAGLRGPSLVFEDKWGGFFKSFNHQQGETAKFVEQLGEVWKINRVSLKPYASCRGTHSAIDALSDILMQENRSAAEIERIDVRLSTFLMDMCGQPKFDTLPAAQMSLAYALAAKAVYGNVELSAYIADRREGPDIYEFLKKIHLHPDPAMPSMDEPDVSILFKNGDLVERTVPFASGSSARPLSQIQIVEKFESLSNLVLSESITRQMQNVLLNLEQVSDMREVAALLASTEANEALI